MEKDKASIDDMYNDLVNLGRIFGVEEKANSLVDGYRLELSKERETLKKEIH